MVNTPERPIPDCLLLVEDDAQISKVIVENLVAEGFSMKTAASGEAALGILEAAQVDLVILDLMLPGISGFEVLRALRGRENATPVLVLSARSETSDRLSGLNCGADDYLCKPFSILELIARVQAILRRARPRSAPVRTFRSGPLTINTLLMKVQRGRTTLDITTKEFRLLQILVSHPGRIHSRRELISMAWEREAWPTPRAVDAHIGSLRKKLGGSARNPFIQTVEGEGYRWVSDVEPLN